MKLFVILLASAIIASGLSATELKRSMKVIPLDSKYLSTEYGGTNHSSAVLADGVGVYSTSFDEYARAISYLNGKYGSEALKNEESLKEYVIKNGAKEDKELAEKLVLDGSQASIIGDPCDDEDDGTINDIYIDKKFTCEGEKIIGTPCDDGKDWTENDIYIDLNYTCEGQNSVIGAACDDKKETTTNDKYVDENFTCKGSNLYEPIRCYGQIVGTSFTADDGKTYLVVGNSTIKSYVNSRAATICTSNVTNMNGVFKNNTAFNGYIEKWDTSNVTTMKEMFYYAKAFNQSIASWDTSKVTDMSYMFLGAAAFNKPIGDWDVSNVTGMGYMFSGATNFNQPIENWVVSNVNNMSTMFNYASSFNKDIGNWDVSNVTDMSRMFADSTFNRPIGNWNVSNVYSMSYMFESTRFNQNISKWCVKNISSQPYNFAIGRLTQENRPIWGTCPTK